MKIAISLVFLSLVPALAGLVRLFGLASGTLSLDGHARFAADPLPAVLHIVCATSFATIGALQFAPALRRRRWHRLAGRLLAPFGIIAALSGLWMTLRWTPKPFDGAALTAMRIVVATAMVAFILRSITAVRRRDFNEHGRWMTRAYALGAGAGTQFFTALPMLAFSSLQSTTGIAVQMGAGWLINVLVAEWVLRRSPAPPPRLSISPALRAELRGA